MRVLSIASLASLTYATLPVDELVTDLPSIGNLQEMLASKQISFQMYSGYVEVTKTKQLHYVLVTSQRDMATDPL